MLDEFNIPQAEHQELLGLLLPLRDEIVEVESPATGTPLPAAYRPTRRRRELSGAAHKEAYDDVVVGRRG